MTWTLSVPRTIQALEQGIDDALHLGGQLAVYHQGKLVIDVAVGQARPGEAMRSDHLLRWMSAGKPLTAIGIAQLYDQGALQLHDPVARFIPAFAQHGKQAITLEHLLTHTVSFPNESVRFDVEWNQIIAELCASPLETDWQPGAMAAYQPLGTWFLLGEIIQRVSGRALDVHLREVLLEPAGMMDSWVGMPSLVYERYGPRLAPLYDTRGGQIGPPIRHTEQEIVPANPGSNATGPVRELARFYQMLLEGGQIEGTRIIQEQTVELFTTPRRVGQHDRTMQHKLDWALGFAVDSKQYGAKTVPYSFGPHASGTAFGHGGMQSSVGFADPAHDLAVAYVCNGLPGEPTHHKRNNAILKALYEDLGLAG